MEKHKENLKRLFTTIPEFIDPKKREDKELWMLLQDSNFIISKLISTKFLTDRAVEKLVEDWNYIEFIIRNNIDSKQYFTSQVFLVGILEICEIYCLDEELYESCSNLKKFKESL